MEPPAGSLRAPIRGALLLLAVLPAGCHPGPPPGSYDPLPLRGLFEFEGRAHGTHRYHDRSESFTRELRGTVDFLPYEVHVYFGAFDPSCVIPREDIHVGPENQVTFTCEARMAFGDGWARASIPVTEEYEWRGPCTSHEILADGRRGRCLEYQWEIRYRTSWKATVLTVRPVGQS